MNNKIGALWLKKDKFDNEYLSGEITIEPATLTKMINEIPDEFEGDMKISIPINIFKNKNKLQAKHPDNTIYGLYTETGEPVLRMPKTRELSKAMEEHPDLYGKEMQ